MVLRVHLKSHQSLWDIGIIFNVSVKGQMYTVIINDEKVIDGFHGNRSKEGYIGLQNHDDKSTVYFRNIFIKEIS